MDHDGNGVPQDYAEAAKWYMLAAQQGSTEAQMILGAMKVKGQVVPRDYVRAHLLYSLAVLHGAKLVAKGRDTIAEHMTLGQVAEAQRLAREWMAKFQARGGEEVGGSRH